jgi:hypothetical protein
MPTILPGSLPYHGDGKLLPKHTTPMACLHPSASSLASSTNGDKRG